MKEKGLPKNRFDMFFDTFQMSWSSLVYFSLFLGIFLLPTILVIVFSQMTGVNILTRIDQTNSEQILQATIEYYYHNIYTILHMFPCFIIASFGFAGCFNIMKKIVWLEKVEFINSFKQGIKGNISKIIFNAVILTFIYAVGCLTYLYIVFNELTPLVITILIVLSSLVMLFLLNIVFCGFSQMVVYVNNLISYIKNCLIFSTFSFIRSILIILLTLILVPLGLLFESSVGIVIVYSFYLLIGFGYMVLLLTLNYHQIFDNLINKDKYPSIYRKGLSD